MSHPLSTSTSGPATPDGVLNNVRGEVEEGAYKQLKNREQVVAPAPGSVTMSPENGALLAEVLEQNTSLRERYNAPSFSYFGWPSCACKLRALAGSSNCCRD